MRFHYFYCVIGLGLIALLLTAIYDFASAMKEEAKNHLLLKNTTGGAKINLEGKPRVIKGSRLQP